MTPEEVFERADEITAETGYRIQFAREARHAGFEAGRRSAFEEMARAWAQAAKAVTGPVNERRWGPSGRAHFADPRPGDFPGAECRNRIGGKCMNDTQTATEYNAVPHDPTMATADPAMFSPMTPDENSILQAHLNSGWYKQCAVYPTLSEPWRETAAVLDDLHGAWQAAWQAAHDEPEAPEAGS